MTLRSCYRATCDAPGCRSATFLPHSRTAACRRQLEELGWGVIKHRARPNSSGAPRISYVCPKHLDWRPRAKRKKKISLRGIKVPTAHLIARRRAAMWWMLRKSEVSYSAIARALGLTPARVREVVEAYARRIERRIQEANSWQEPWAQRLRAAGAIR